MIAQFSRQQDPDLEEKHLIVYNGGVACPDVVKETTNDYVIIEIPVKDCGTINTQSNTSHIVYTNTISYLYTTQEGFITRKNTYQVRITCALPTELAVTQRVQPLTETVTQKATGTFVTSMEVYRNDTFDVPVIESPVRIPLGEWLNMAVIMENNDPNLKLVLTDCVTTPTGDVSQNPFKRLVSDKCPEEDTISLYPLNNFKMGFRFKPFKFVGHDLLYVHCNALVCRAEDDTRLCDRTCNNAKPDTAATGKKRKKRAIFDKFIRVVRSPMIILYDPDSSQQGNQDNSDNIGWPTVSIISATGNISEINKDKGSSASSFPSKTTYPAVAVATTTSSPVTTQQQLPLEPPPKQSDSLHVIDSETLDSNPGNQAGLGSGSKPRPTPPSLIRSGNSGNSHLRSTVSDKYLFVFVLSLIAVFIMVTRN
ncbi:cub and zona pellucida-like domain-containing protein 1 [Plakobranchus ocellatus]|uniref:Cub and zona pellucida-like domain-containing protein 1 n=1 Tax=Plakobranchus ocellatus TaxID=259542 RepID=A0AAV4A3Z2_9GAST|nr:cub and zona pellucida-like domain-containing protein 1 [Plakobranchus ocellatus]